MYPLASFDILVCLGWETLVLSNTTKRHCALKLEHVMHERDIVGTHGTARSEDCAIVATAAAPK